MLPIDWATVAWPLVGLLAVFAFLASLIGNSLAGRSKFAGAVLTAILFAALYIFWNYYPHGIVLPKFGG
ncbi:MAG: hypothetical protein AB7K67_15645 [Hyphomicrobiaceae bacterium]